MNYQRIEYFLKTAESKSIALAAEQIHISHQALSRQLILLEKEVGTVLFLRSKTGLSLTDSGEKFYREFQPIYENLQKKYDDFCENIKKETSHLSIGYFDGLSFRQFVSPIINQLIDEHPDLAIDFESNNLEQLFVLLDSNKIDLAITVCYLTDIKNDCQTILLCTSTLKVYLSEKHPLYQKTSLDIHDLSQCELLVHSNRPAEGNSSFFANLPVKKRIVCNNYDTYLAHLEEGRGIALLGENVRLDTFACKAFPLPEGFDDQMQIQAVFKRDSAFAKLLSNISYTA